MISAKNSNKMNHISNGNIKGSLKLLHFNKGNSKLANKMDDILYIIGTHKPDLFSLQEANLDIKDIPNIQGYNIEFSTLSPNYNISRTVVLIKEGINYSRRQEYEDTDISSVWLEIILKKVSHFIFVRTIDSGLFHLVSVLIRLIVNVNR